MSFLQYSILQLLSLIPRPTQSGVRASVSPISIAERLLQALAGAPLAPPARALRVCYDRHYSYPTPLPRPAAGQAPSGPWPQQV